MTTDENCSVTCEAWPDCVCGDTDGGEPIPLAQKRHNPITLDEMLKSMEAHYRAEFEQLAYQHYLDRKAAGKIDPTAEGDGTPEALFWKQEDGSYGVLMFNAAWQGFKWGRGLV